MNRGLTVYLIFGAIVLLCLVEVGNAKDLDRMALHIGFGRTSSCAVNWSDAKAAFKVFTESLGTQWGYDLDVVIHSYTNDEEFLAAVTNDVLHLVIMVPWYYMDKGLEDHLEPCFLPIDAGGGARKWVLLVHAKSRFRSLSDLRGSHLVLLQNTHCEMSEYWLATELLETECDRLDSFFKSIVIKDKPTQAVLPVFFGTKDCCVTTQPVFEMMRQLNPQIGERLRVIAVSEPLVNTIEYVACDGPQWTHKNSRRDLIYALKTVHLDPRGVQIMTLFKTDRLALYDDSYMVGTRALKAKYDRLRGQKSVSQTINERAGLQ